MTIYKKLQTIQQQLNAPKDQHNDFGNYNYRSAESILAAVKPLLDEQGCVLLLSDDVKLIGGAIFVVATATLLDTEATGPVPVKDLTGHGTAGYVAVSAWARHPESKRGMDDSQITGAASSYARKYALNGLFAIDDTKDADALPPSKATKAEKGDTSAHKGETPPQNAPERPRRSKELQLVFDMTQVLAGITGEKPGQIARKLESYVGHPINEELNTAHYARIKQWFKEQGVSEDD